MSGSVGLALWEPQALSVWACWGLGYYASEHRHLEHPQFYFRCCCPDLFIIWPWPYIPCIDRKRGKEI